MFHSARIKLTAWYLVIIMAISALFSLAIYSNVNTEFRRFERLQERIRQSEEDGVLSFQIYPGPSSRVGLDMVSVARARVISTLGVINLFILVLAGGAAYFLAGRTLRPIKQMVDEQNRFISDASHEFRTPLTSLRSEIEVGLRSKTLTLSEARRLLESNLEEVVDLQVLSDGLLELAQNGKPLSRSNMKNVHITESIDTALRKLDALIKKKEIRIKKDLQNASVLGVEDRLVETFVILLDNAIKYSPTRSTIEIKAKKLDKTILVSITDQGIGIEEQDLPYVFDRFFRASKSRSKEAVSGYGLGLSIAKKIITTHYGTISVKSILGEGTTFTIQLPSK